ncbi:MAG: single-stranded-DNA-specific exonuclease RecJ [Thermoplasmatota archaeon]
MVSLKTQEWRFRKEDIGLAQSISEKLDIDMILSRILACRSIRGAEQAYDFLHPNLRNLHDPFLFRDMEPAVNRIGEALETGEGITVHGDYDVDGITSTALLLTALSERAGKGALNHFLPSRFEEGYGISRSCMDEMSKRGDTLLITVDCGIKAIEEIESAGSSGIDVILTDHHEPGKTVPDASAVIDPKVEGTDYPFKELAGVGVAFKLATALQMRELIGTDVRELLDLVALGTVSDLVPLIDENRPMVHFGLDRLGTTNHIGLAMLMSESGLDPRRKIRSGDVAFKLGPRMNSAGRLAHPGLALDLILTKDRVDAELFARELSTLNFKRQAIGKRLVTEVLEEIERNGYADDPFLVVGKNDWNPGVIGVSAAKLVEITGKPTIVLTIENEIARGSARAPGGFNLVEALGSVSDLLLEHGGHERAAGLTLRYEEIPELRRRLCHLVDERYPDHSFIPQIDIDLDLNLSELDLDSVISLEALGPIGMGNPQPVISVRDVSIGYDISAVGEGKHLKFSIVDKESSIGCIWFNMGNLLGSLGPGSVVTVAGVPEVHSWRGSKDVQLRILDIYSDG